MTWRPENKEDRSAGYRIVAVQCPDGHVRTMLGAFGDNKRTRNDWYVTGNLGGLMRSEFEGWCGMKGTEVLAVFDPPAYKRDTP